MKASNVFVKLVNKSIKKEADSACIIIGYQPKMPAAVKSFKKVK